MKFLNFFRKPHPKVDPEELDRQTQAVKLKLEVEVPRMHAFTSYLDWRNESNGFGDDVEVTFRVREA